MNKDAESAELAMVGVKVLDKSDRRLEGLSFLSELKREPGFTPIEYKGYIFLFIFNSGTGSKKIDHFIALQPYLDNTIEMNKNSIDKHGYDLTGFCHETSEALAQGLGGQRLQLDTGIGSIVGVEYGHSLVKVTLDDEVVAAFDPTQPSRGQHDPLDPTTFKLRETVISPLVIIGAEIEVGKKLAHYYKDNLNELLSHENSALKLWRNIKQAFR